MTPPRTITDKAAFQGRRKKAEAFFEAAELIFDDADSNLWDVIATLYVHAGIAASDYIQGSRNGSYEQSQNHQDAVKPLRTISSEWGNDLQFLLNIKTRAGYGYDPVTRDSLTKARRAASRLVEATTL